MALAFRAPELRMEAHGVMDGRPVDNDAAMLFEIDLPERSGDRSGFRPQMKSPFPFSLQRRGLILVRVLFLGSRASAPRGVNWRLRFLAPEEIGDQIHCAWEIEAFDVLNELDEVAASAGADPARPRVVPTPRRAPVLVSGDGAGDVRGLFPRGPGDPEPAQEFEFPAAQAGFRLVDRKARLAQDNRFLIRVLDDAAGIPAHGISDLLGMTLKP